MSNSNHTFRKRVFMKSFVKSLQLIVPGMIARFIPILLFSHYLEDAVVIGLVPVVAAITVHSLISNLILLQSQEQTLYTQCACGIMGLVLGTTGFHIIIVLFGAPVVDLWTQTLLLAILLSSCTTMPLALHFGCATHKWLDLLLELSVTNAEERYLVCSSIGAMLGAYIGALPIPLDWDRPWQQWPLTCVYGTLLGHATGILVSVAASTTLTPSFVKSTKED